MTTSTVQLILTIVSKALNIVSALLSRKQAKIDANKPIEIVQDTKTNKKTLDKVNNFIKSTLITKGPKTND